ncbi:synaptic vesicle glycoprotein 2B [Aphomia sociella]
MNSELKAKTRGCEVVENKSYGYDEAVDLCGHGSYSRYLLATCCVISNAVALDMFGFSIIVAASSCDLQLGLTETGLLASAPFAGVIFGFPWGYYADTRGRKRALLLSNAFGFAFAALSSFSISWQIMLVLKIIGCSFSSASYTMSIIYLGESIVSQHRSQYTFIMQAAYLGSELFSFALAYFLLPLDFKISIPWLAIDFRSWRLLSLIMAAWLGLGALMLIFARESPKFLANKGEYENALKVLQVIYEGNGGKKDDYPVKQLHIEEVQNSGGLCWQSIKEQTVPLFKPPLLCCTIFLFYLLAICASTNNIFFMWYPTMVNLFFNSVSNGSSSSSFCDKITDAIGTDNVVNGVCDDTISVNTLYSGMLYGVLPSFSAGHLPRGVRC